MQLKTIVCERQLEQRSEMAEQKRVKRRRLIAENVL